MEILCLVIVVGIGSLGWVIDRRFDRLENYINDRFADLETELIYKKK